MKLKRTSLVIAALIAVTIATSSAAERSPKSQADKANGKQSGTVTVKVEAVIPGAEAQPASYFYTGKPYDQDLGGYVFNYRTYSPAMGRWTTPDPSGFPDGTNNCIYAPVPVYELDLDGLKVVNTYEGHWKEKVTFTFATYSFQSWSIDRGYAQAAPKGQPVSLVYTGLSWQWWPPGTVPAGINAFSIISSLVKLTNNSITGLKLVGVENVTDVIWKPATVNSQKTYTTVATAESDVKYDLVYE